MRLALKRLNISHVSKGPRFEKNPIQQFKIYLKLWSIFKSKTDVIHSRDFSDNFFKSIRPVTHMYDVVFDR